MPKRAAPYPDSRSAMADCPRGAGDGEESSKEEQDVDEEDEVEEIVKEEEEDDDEGQEGSQGEGEESGDSSDAESPPGDAHDASEKTESGGSGKSLKSGSSIYERSGIIRTPTVHGHDDIGNFSAFDPSAKLVAMDGKKASAINYQDTRSAVQDKYIMSSEENKFPISHLADRGNKVLLEKETSTESSKDVRRYNIEIHGSHKSHLSSSSFIGVKDTRFLHVNENKLESMIKSGSRYGKTDGLIEKDALNPCTKINLQPPEDSSTSSMHFPQRRPRSSSPGAPPEILGKRPAMICDFFKKGWCIRGNSCSFLHLKEEDIRSSQWSKENIAEPTIKHDSVDHTGSRQEAQRFKLSTSHEPLDSLKFEKPSKLDSQRALVRAYGGESHGLTQFHDDHNKHSSKIPAEEHFRFDISGSSGASNLPVNELTQASLVREGYQKPIGVSPYVDSMYERRSVSGEFLSRRYLDEVKLHQEMPKGEFLNDATFSRASPLSRNPLIQECGSHSDQSSVATGLQQNSNSPYSYGKMTQDVVIGCQQSRFPPPDPKYCSSSLSNSLNSRFDNSLHPLHGSPSVQTHTQIGVSSTSGSAPFIAEHLDSKRPLDFDRGYYGSRSASLPRNSSPCYSRPELESSTQQGILQDIRTSAPLKMQMDYWEPSERFQSSFYAPASKSSSGSQYDPLIDSFEPPKAGNVTTQTSSIASIHNVSSQHINNDPILSGHAPEYSSQKPLNSLHHSTKGIFDESTSAHQFSGHITTVAAPGPEAAGGKSSMPKDEKRWAPHETDGENVNEADLGGNTSNQVDKAQNDRESKAVRNFRAALVDFVKELIKPFWREGHLSKDAHKTIVKKAVEKVISSLQPHQIPSTAESINHYLSLSQTKLFKLVEAYMDKYTKY